MPVPPTPIARVAARALTAAMLAWPAMLAPAGGSAAASDAITAADIADLRQWAAHPIVIELVRAQNARHAGIGDAEIEALDAQWRTERDSDRRPLIASRLSNPLSSYLTRIQARSLGLYAEIFVTDEHGLNVGQSAITSDYWQGDEDKYLRTLPVGPDAVWIDAVERHEATGTDRVQVNLTVADPDSGTAIGVLTVEVNVTELDRRRAAGL